MARSASVSKKFFMLGLFICMLQTSVTPVLRNKFTPPANVSVLVLHIIIVVKVELNLYVLKCRRRKAAGLLF